MFQLNFSMNLSFCFLVMLSILHQNLATYPREKKTVRGVNETWGYVTVRPKAHMFWWYMNTTNPKGSSDVPLVLWLQGGPGASSTGYGNFEEIGPLDTSLNPRQTTWLSEVNLLFVDNPVGTGYSYVEDDSAYTTDVHQIAKDLLSILKVFLSANGDLKKVPFYIFSESYGGKMTAAFSQALYWAVEFNDIKCNFKGFAMGDSWISPLASVRSWGTYLYVNSLVDKTQFMTLNKMADNITDLTMKGEWGAATSEWSALEDKVEAVTDGVNFYNIQQWTSASSAALASRKNLSSFDRAFRRHVGALQEVDLAKLMNGPIRKKLGVIPANVTWGGQSGMVFLKQSEDFMKPVTGIVNNLILDTPLKVVVYSGQLDLIVDVVGTEAWVNELKIKDKFSKASKNALKINGIPQAFVKTVDNFEFYYILAAGHMVPSDNGPAALMMLKRIIASS